MQFVRQLVKQKKIIVYVKCRFTCGKSKLFNKCWKVQEHYINDCRLLQRKIMLKSQKTKTSAISEFGGRNLSNQR